MRKGGADFGPAVGFLAVAFVVLDSEDIHVSGSACRRWGGWWYQVLWAGLRLFMDGSLSVRNSEMQRAVGYRRLRGMGRGICGAFIEICARDLYIAFRAGVNPLGFAVPAAHKPGVAVNGHPSIACVRPMEPAGKTCDAMLSCIAASQGPASVPVPLEAMPRAPVLHAPSRNIEIPPVVVVSSLAMRSVGRWDWLQCRYQGFEIRWIST
jgi:hypothetical protein